MNDHLRAMCERPDTITNTCVAADHDGDAGPFDAVARGGFYRVMVDEGRSNGPSVRVHHGDDVVDRGEAMDVDARSTTGPSSGLRVEAVVVEGIETGVGESCRSAVGSVHCERRCASGRPTCDRQRGEVADVV